MAPKKWNLQDIRPTDTEKRETAAVAMKDTTPPRRESDMRRKVPPPPQEQHRQEEAESVDYEGVSSILIEDGNKKRRMRIVVGAFILLLLIGSFFGTSTLLGGAEIVVTPKNKDVTVGMTIDAKTAPAAGELGYELLTLEANGERQVSASGKENVSERAKGSIFIYNAHSEGTQRLIKNTRFESPEGLIFRIDESVEVPGKTTDSKGNVVPGVVEASVFSDGTGEQYNLEASRFTIPGLKDTDQYTTMYAESKKAFTGGFEGEKYIIDTGELETAKQALHAELRDALLARLPNETPAGFVLYDGAITFTYDSLPSTEFGDELATIKESGRLQVPLLKEDQLAEYIAKGGISGYEGEAVELTDPHALTFKYSIATTSLSDISTVSSLKFDLIGDTTVVWLFDEEQLKKDLAGKAKTAVPTVISGYPAIDGIIATVKPFWRTSFPENTGEMNLTISLE